MTDLTVFAIPFVHLPSHLHAFKSHFTLPNNLLRQALLLVPRYLKSTLCTFTLCSAAGIAGRLFDARPWYALSETQIGSSLHGLGIARNRFDIIIQLKLSLRNGHASRMGDMTYSVPILLRSLSVTSQNCLISVGYDPWRLMKVWQISSRRVNS